MQTRLGALVILFAVGALLCVGMASCGRGRGPEHAPMVRLSAGQGNVAPGGISTLTWSSIHAKSCSATGGWSGAKALSGSESTPAMTTTATFTLACTGAGGTVSSTTSVSVDNKLGPLSGQWDCKGNHFEPVNTVAGLPLEVRRILLKDGTVADRGQQFQDTDVVVENLPSRRLEIAAVSDSRIAAAIERGNFPTDVWWFERGDKGWTGFPAGQAPWRRDALAAESFDTLLHIVCRGYTR